MSSCARPPASRRAARTPPCPRRRGRAGRARRRPASARRGAADLVPRLEDRQAADVDALAARRRRPPLRRRAASRRSSCAGGRPVPPAVSAAQCTTKPTPAITAGVERPRPDRRRRTRRRARAADARRPPRQHADAEPGVTQLLDERDAEQAGAAGDEHERARRIGRRDPRRGLGQPRARLIVGQRLGLIERRADPLAEIDRVEDRLRRERRRRAVPDAAS